MSEITLSQKYGTNYTLEYNVFFLNKKTPLRFSAVLQWIEFYFPFHDYDPVSINMSRPSQSPDQVLTSRIIMEKCYQTVHHGRWNPKATPL